MLSLRSLIYLWYTLVLTMLPFTLSINITSQTGANHGFLSIREAPPIMLRIHITYCSYSQLQKKVLARILQHS